MNGKELFLGLSYINRTYIDEAERDTVSNHGRRERAGTSTVRGLRRPLLVAALAALLLLLVGCAVVYVLRMQDVKIGEATETRDYRLVDGTYVEDPQRLIRMC